MRWFLLIIAFWPAWAFTDLQAKANTGMAQQFSGDEQGEGKLAAGEQTLEGVKFKLGPKYMQLASSF